MPSASPLLITKHVQPKETMRKTILLALCCTLWPLRCESQEFVQDDAHFRKAISFFGSSSPYFIFIKVIDARNDVSRSFCVEAPFLLVALRHEMGLDTYKKALDIALSNTGHVFRFSKQEALDNLPLRYTEAELDQARKMIETHGVAPLMGVLSEKRKEFGNLQWRPALACALIEKGLSARRADISGQIYAES